MHISAVNDNTDPETVHNCELGFGIDNDSSILLKGDKCVRTIRVGAEDVYLEFLRSAVAQRLQSEGRFVECTVLSRLPNGAVQVEHPLIKFPTYPYEWSASALRSAATFFLDLLCELNLSGYTLKDGHPWNILFRGASPVWVDLTSIKRLSSASARPELDDFFNYFVLPLRLFACGLNSHARFYLSQLFIHPDSWLEAEAARGTLTRPQPTNPEGIKSAARRLLSLVTKRVRPIPPVPPAAKQKAPDAISHLRRIIASTDCLSAEGEWSNYYVGNNGLPVFNPEEGVPTDIEHSTAKHRLIAGILRENRPKTVLDIGCNSGLYSFMAASLGAEVLGVDIDEQALDRMFLAARKNDLKVQCICADFVSPLMPSEYMHKPRLRKLHDRAAADLTLCLALVHHWVFKRLQLKFPDVAAILSAVTANTLVVEFVPEDDVHVSKWMTPDFGWYTLDNFIASLGAYFQTVTVHASFPSPRLLLVCSR